MTLKDIKKTVEHVTGLSLTKNTRKREYVYARFIYFYLARKYGKKEFIIDGCVKYYDCSLDSIGKLINKDHATVIHGCKQMLIIPQQDEKVNIWLIACEKLVVDQIDDIEDDTFIKA